MSEAKTSKKIDWNDPSVLKYHALKMKPKTVAQARKNMIKYLKNQGNYKISDFKGNFMYYQIFRGDGSSKNYKVLSEILEDFDRQDVEECHTYADREEIPSKSRDDFQDVEKEIGG
ncbi:hypothetical protein Tco_1204298 [Tanacetum coccineum]